MATPLKFVGDDRALVGALRAGHPGAVDVLYERHARAVHRTLRSILGPDGDLPDLLQEVFIAALQRITQLEDEARLRSWLVGIAVLTARQVLRRRTRRSWLNVFSPQRGAPTEQNPPSFEARFALREVYEILDRLPVDQRVAFALRYIDGMTLPDAAATCGISLSTIKRRIARAERTFLAEVEKRPALQPWLERGTRWGLPRQG